MERGCSREDLLVRWREIEEEEEDAEEDGLSSSKDKMLRRVKETWFSDTFKFLMHLPEETHLWCGFFDLMGPLLETFHNYFNDKRTHSPLKTIWKRASRELNQCTQCVCQLHQAQEAYSAEYECETVGPLLKILQCLDEERIADHLEDMNARIRQKLFDREGHAAEVVSILFEVLMFPTLLDDQSLVTNFESFLEAIDKSHELSLARNQQYSGIYALLFLRNSKARAIGLRLAGGMGKLRSATDLEPLQPLLKKYIIILETDMLLETDTLQTDFNTSRPRVRTERSSVWLGFKALLGFLESPAFEEGILERHPIFLSIVLNHVSDDTPDFSSAVTCLRLFFEMLGCKLWLRTTISPSVMRNTLLGQCFHTADEKIHKEIFDLFLPFLQSLEALQNGEHEKQRRHFLYFLLHQVPHSSNFSELMRKNGCKIALCIIQHGYKMNPPCPPFECSHVWGPSLVSCLKNLSLHKSLRQPALDLIQTIIVSDCAALASMQLNLSSVSTTADTFISPELYDDEDEIPFFHDIKENDSSCWNDFQSQSKLAFEVHKDWRCIPMLWHDVFVGSHPSILPMSFFKAVVWGISHLPMLDSDISIDHKLSVKEWLTTYAGEISASFMWEVPQGYDDGADGKESKSSLNASFVYIPLIRTFKRFATQYITTTEALELHKQLTWEPRISESLILLLINPNDIVRHANRIILEHLSNTQGLTSGLQFLSTNAVSLYATYMGLKYATNQVQANHLLLTFHTLHHLFFVVRKILKEVVVYPQQLLGNSTEKTKHSVLLSEGGFLRYPCNLTPQVISPGSSSVIMDAKLCINFSFFLSASMWPSILKCLFVGKKFIDSKNCQMTCVRLLEILPVAFEWLITFSPHLLPSSRTIVYGISDLRWLFDLVDWGKSSLTVVIRHWKQSMLSIIGLLKGFHDVNNKWIFHAMEQIMSFDAVALDELKGKVSQITLSLSKEATRTADWESKKPSSSLSKPFYSEDIVDGMASSYGLKDSSLTAAENVNNRENDKVIFSDKENENVQTRGLIPSPGSDKVSVQGHQAYVGKSTLVSNRDIHQEPVAVHIPEDTVEHNLISEVIDDDGGIVHKEGADKRGAKMLSHSFGESISLVKSTSKHGKQDLKISQGGTGISISKPDAALRNALGKLDNKSMDQDLPSRKISVNKPDALIKESVCVADNPLDLATFAARHSSTLPSKPCVSVPKRKVVHLEMPTSNRRGHLSKYTEYNRHRPPRLDEWYKPILELDYFSLIGLSSDKDNVAPTSHLKEVPLCFHSPEHYVEIFQPLLLEEFKAQMHNSCLEVSSSDIFCSILSVHSVERIDDFHLIRGSFEECDSSASGEYSENDLVLLTKEPLKNFVQPFHALGKVERRERNNKIKSTILSVKVYLQSGLPRLVKVKKFLIERSKWHISRIMSITPQLREFQALSSLNDIPLLPLILSPTNSSNYADMRKSSLEKLPEPLQRILKSSFNESQLQAIGIVIETQGSSKAFELSLIQGPPGTGKTRTIVAIVSSLLASKIVPSKMLINNSMSHGAALMHPRARVSQTTAVARAWQDAALAKQIVKDEVREYSESRLSKGRILICAQSNAAVDELVSRISSGIYGNDGKFYKPFLVRVGNIKTVHPSSLPFFIDTLVEQRLAEHKIQSDTKRDVDGGTIMSFRVKLEKIVESIQLFESRRAKLRDADMENKSSLENAPSKVNDAKEISDAEIGGKLKVLYAQKKTLCGHIATAQAQERKLLEESKILKNKIRRSIIREAEVVVSTLSGCGGDIYGVCSEYASGKFGNFSEHSLFDAVVIDEAAQALEPATLIPLQLLKSTGTKCVMVGDPKQLPATVFSNVASKYLYECSMFERLQRAGHHVIMLKEQYRMHPEICKFPSSHFYEDALINGVSKSSMSAPFHEDSFLQPYLFFDVTDGRESQGKSCGSLSLYNGAEAEAAIEILKFFRNRYPSEFSTGRIGVITPYKSQLSLLRSRCNSEFGASMTADMEFKTVDGFQGREVDVMLLSTVRASDPCLKKPAATSSLIGFVADARRMNVALTRAKFSLWIVGNERTLQTDLHWAALLKDAKERDMFRSLLKPYKSCLERSRPSKKAGSQSNLHSLAKNSKHETHEGSRSGNLHASNIKELNGQVKPKDGEAGKHTSKNSLDCSKKAKILSYKTSPCDHRTQENKKSSTSAQESELVKKLASEVRGSQSKKSFPHCRDASRETIKYNQDTVSPLDNEFKGKLGVKSNKNTYTSEAQSSRFEKRVLNDGEVQKESHARSKKEKSVLELKDISSRNMNLLEPHVAEACIGRQIQEEVPHMQDVSDQGNAYRHLTSARKRQREAVNSLLSSSLLSSKKSEVSLRFTPLQKPLSQPAFESNATRPVRSGKAKQSKTKRLDEE